MLECVVSDVDGVKMLFPSGRIDSMTSSDIEIPIKELAQSGERLIVIDFGQVSYVSSAGLRVFMTAQKLLKKANGELILCNMSNYVFDVFKSGGFDRIIKITDGKYTTGSESSNTIKTEFDLISLNDIDFKFKKNNVKKGTFNSLGKTEKLNDCSYSVEDLVNISPSETKFGFGLAGLGDIFEDYKDLIGESIILNNSLFVYPAVPKPVVDFMIYSQGIPNIEYHFLNGFSYKGDYAVSTSFASNSLINLDKLINSLFEMSGLNFIGINLISESKGIWGMNLKKVPLIDNQPKDKNIFSDDNFPVWMNFSVEPENINFIVAAAGFAIKDKNLVDPQIAKLLPDQSNYHIHGAIFEKQLLNKDPLKIDEEIERIITDLDVVKVQHLLGQTKLGSGIAGIIDLSV